MGYGKLLCYEVLPFVFDYQLNRDNSAVLVVSPLLSVMMDQVDSVQAETAGFCYHLERCHADDVTSNLAHAIYRRPASFPSVNTCFLQLNSCMREWFVPGSLSFLPPLPRISCEAV